MPKGGKTNNQTKDRPEPRQQCAALPYIEGKNGKMVLLVTSRETHRWVIPKGWPKKSLSASATAAAEAFEEAGLIGDIAETSIGIYHYTKRLPDGTRVPCAVSVFPLRVTQSLEDWPERADRDRRWFTAIEASELVHEPELTALLRRFANTGGH